MKWFETGIVVGLDVGNYNVKTASQCFTSGIKEVGGESIFDHMLTYENRHYTLSSERTSMGTDKTTSDTMLLLSLFGIARELKANDVPGGAYEMILAVGLPPGFLTIGGLKKKMQDYYLNRFQCKYNTSIYDLHVKRVFVCPQDYAAVLADTESAEMTNRLGKFQRPIELLAKEPHALLFDIGGGTLDVVGLEYGRPVPQHHFSLKMGIVNAYNDINAELLSITGNEISESVINNVLAGADVRISPEEKAIIFKHIRLYGDMMLAKLLELKLPIRNSYSLLLGGGSQAIREHWMETGRFGKLDYIPDICANAKGFEQMALNALTAKRQVGA